MYNIDLYVHFLIVLLIIHNMCLPVELHEIWQTMKLLLFGAHELVLACGRVHQKVLYFSIG